MDMRNIDELIKLIQILDINIKLRHTQADIDELNNEIQKINWDDYIILQNLNKRLSDLNKLAQTYNLIISLRNDLVTSCEIKDDELTDSIYNSLLSLVKSVQDRLYLSGCFDNNSAYLSIFAGAGGVDAEDFAAMLVNMYQGFCKKEGLQCSIVSLSKGREGGATSVTMKIDGSYAYGLLKEEIGVHRLIRISPFNSGNTRETSFAAIEVLPQNIKDQSVNINLKDEDLKIDTFMASGKGGQGVNTTYSAVRVTHILTGVSVSCQNQRNQIQNKAEAISILKDKLVTLELLKQKKYVEDLKGISKSIEWGSQIRTYTLHPYKLVKDNRSGYETSDVDAMLSGDLVGDFIWSIKKTKEYES